MIVEVAPAVYSLESRFVAGKYGIVLGRRGALTVDVGFYPDEGQAMADFVRAHGYSEKAIQKIEAAGGSIEVIA